MQTVWKVYFLKISILHLKYLQYTRRYSFNHNYFIKISVDGLCNWYHCLWLSTVWLLLKMYYVNNNRWNEFRAIREISCSFTIIVIYNISNIIPRPTISNAMQCQFQDVSHDFMLMRCKNQLKHKVSQLNSNISFRWMYLQRGGKGVKIITLVRRIIRQTWHA